MTEMLNIVKGVPLPSINRGTPKGVRRKYPFEKMEVGDWVFVERRSTKSVSAYISRTTKPLPGSFATRPCWAIKNGDKWEPAEVGSSGAVEGTGVWRVS